MRAKSWWGPGTKFPFCSATFARIGRGRATLGKGARLTHRLEETEGIVDEPRALRMEVCSPLRESQQEWASTGHWESCSKKKKHCLSENIQAPERVLNASDTNPRHSYTSINFWPCNICLQMQKEVVGGVECVSRTNRPRPRDVWNQGCSLGAVGRVSTP